MTETKVKNETCRHCNADIRPDTDFCYNCGGALALETKAGDASPSIESENIDSVKPTTKIKIDAAEKTSAVAPIAEPKLKSAASLRRKSKIYQPKRVEVTWEEHENAPNGWFILAALTLTLFAGVVFYLAIYLK
ncbi:MAG: zinc ribbon domain-containing protein [Acidobacteriota bacterium]|nr:zinc ribbon domain-containing protein [Acidobacteriota bacterium]